jgi:hypothetical protein
VSRAWPALLTVAALVPAPAALGATARFEVPDDHGVLHSSPTAHTVFILPPTFALAHGQLENTPAVGTYELVQPSGQTQCVVTLFGNANAQATMPTVRGGVFAARGLRFRIVRQGRRGARSWFMGRANGEDVAAAFEPPRVGWRRPVPTGCSSRRPSPIGLGHRRRPSACVSTPSSAQPCDARSPACTSSAHRCRALTPPAPAESPARTAARRPRPRRRPRARPAAARAAAARRRAGARARSR